MVSRTAASQARERILRLAHSGLSMADYARAVGQTVTQVVPAEGTCLMTVDPATFLPTAEFVENGMSAPALLRMIDIELRQPDYNTWVALAESRTRAGSLSEATRGDLDASPRQREIRGPGGFSDELRGVLTCGGRTWGQLTVFREQRRPHFTSAEVDFVASVATAIADGLRRGILLDTDQAELDDVGILVLDPEDQVTLTNPAAQKWLGELVHGGRTESALPVAISTTARQARLTAVVPRDHAHAERLRPASTRVRTICGSWLTIRGSLMGRTPDEPVTITLEPARQSELAPIMVSAYGLTHAERRITELVARGLSTRLIAHRLNLSVYTVQDHLKSIFSKSDTASRGDLVARLFVDHYAERLTTKPR